MKIKKRFNNSVLDIKQIPSWRFILAAIIGLTAAFTIYSFFYVLCESFRFMSSGLYNQLIPIVIVDEVDRDIYKMFFALLAMIYGSSIALNFIFSQPQRILDKHNNKRKRILNDQIFLGFNFSHWFLKVIFVVGGLSMGFMDFQYLPLLFVPGILLLVVLYLESWKTLIQVLGKKRWMYQIMHFFLVVILSFGLSQVDIIDYKKIDEVILISNPIIDLPHSDFSNDNQHVNHYPYQIIFFKLRLNENKKPLFYTQDGRCINLTDISEEIHKERSFTREELIPFIAVRVSADKNIRLLHIKQLEAELYIAGIGKIVYDIYNEDNLTRRFHNKGLVKKIRSDVMSFRDSTALPSSMPLPPFFNYKPEYKQKIIVEIVTSMLASKDLDSIFIANISKEIIFEYNFYPKTKYQDYINVLSAHHKIVERLRFKEQTVFKTNRYERSKTFREEQQKLGHKYPLRIVEKFNN